MVTKTAARCALALVVPALLATAAAPAAGSVPPPANGRLDVVARHLENVRGLAFDAYGTLVVAEAGRGGDGPCVPANFGPELCFGNTGAVTAVRHGRQWRVVSGLPSLRGIASETDPASSYGPHDVAFTRGGAMLVSLGYGTSPAYREQLGEPGAALGTIIKMRSPHRWRTVADLAAYEQQHNPDGGGLESQPYGMALGGAGFAVADAAANSALWVGYDGQVSTLGAFPERMYPAPPEWGLPPGTTVPVEAVPVAATRGPDGAFYIGELTGGFFPEGEARVWRVVPGQEPAIHATGFTNIIDLTFDHWGRLLVLEMATNGLDSGDLTGALVRVEWDGSRTVLASDGLVAPTSVAVGPTGDIFVSNNGLSEDDGEVVRFRPRPH